MRRKEELPELLAPAGDFECLVAAVKGGADAIYIGGKMFSARAYAKNFDLDEIKKAVSYCHLHGVKLYVTMNILLFDNELPEALEFARGLYLAGVDALIVADLGLISLLREKLPDFELHASTHRLMLFLLKMSATQQNLPYHHTLHLTIVILLP